MGQIFVMGGGSDFRNILSSCEIYDPGVDKWFIGKGKTCYVFLTSSFTHAIALFQPLPQDFFSFQNGELGVETLRKGSQNTLRFLEHLTALPKGLLRLPRHFESRGGPGDEIGSIHLEQRLVKHRLLRLLHRQT